jgi:hypothetical protein
MEKSGEITGVTARITEIIYITVSNEDVTRKEQR